MIIVLALCVHNIYSSVKLGDVFSVVSSFPQVDLFIISKASSSAAQQGVPEVEKRAFLRGMRVLYVPDLRDVIDVFNPDMHLMIVPMRVAEDQIDLNSVREALEEGKRVLVSIGGSESTFTAKELEYGTPVHIGLENILPPAATAAIILSNLFLKL